MVARGDENQRSLQTEPGEPIFVYQNIALCLYFLTERFPPTKVFMDHQLLPENKDAPQLLREALRQLKQNPPNHHSWTLQPVHFGDRRIDQRELRPGDKHQAASGIGRDAEGAISGGKIR